jgi:hypothetical protein
MGFAGGRRGGNQAYKKKKQAEDRAKALQAEEDAHQNSFIAKQARAPTKT